MILNERQYKVTKGQINKLTSALDNARISGGGLSPRVFEAMVIGIESQIEALKGQLREYDTLRDASVLHMPSINKLGQILTKARVARGYTQKELASKLGMQPQQIKKYEAEEYQCASLRRILDIVKALEIDLVGDISLKPDDSKQGCEENAPPAQSIAASQQAVPTTEKPSRFMRLP